MQVACMPAVIFVVARIHARTQIPHTHTHTQTKTLQDNRTETTFSVSRKVNIASVTTSTGTRTYIVGICAKIILLKTITRK